MFVCTVPRNVLVQSTSPLYPLFAPVCSPVLHRRWRVVKIATRSSRPPNLFRYNLAVPDLHISVVQRRLGDVQVPIRPCAIIINVSEMAIPPSRVLNHLRYDHNQSTSYTTLFPEPISAWTVGRSSSFLIFAPLHPLDRFARVGVSYLPSHHQCLYLP
jgi:hypothetical protein